MVEHKDIKKQWKKQKEELQELGIQIQNEDDSSYFQYEILLKSLEVKAKFEEVFLDTYVVMYDYWYDLTYQERKKQMNVDIDKLKETLVCFDYEGQEIYMPSFDRDFNHLYTDEIVLLDLKQYHTFIRTFSKQVVLHAFGIQPFLHHFSSAQVIEESATCFVLYHACMNRYYVYENDTCNKVLSLDPKKINEDEIVHQQIAEALIKNDEDQLIELMLQYDVVSKHMHKQIEKLKTKKLKIAQKQRKKEEKKQS